MHGGGVAEAISKKGGYVIDDQSRFWIENFGIVPTGCCTFTKSGYLPASYVIHTVGPIWHNDKDKDLL